MSIDPEILRAVLVERLPLSAVWQINGTTLRYDFSLAQRPLAPLPPDASFAPDRDELGLAEFEPQWQAAQDGLLIFGLYNYAEGGGAQPWLGVHETDGVVFGLDAEAERERFFISSSLAQFMATFETLHSLLSAGKALPPDIEATLYALDPRYPESDWHGIVQLAQS